MIKLPDDAPLLKRLNTRIAHLKNDEDRDVAAVAAKTAEKLNSIEAGRGEIECEDDLVDYKKEEVLSRSPWQSPTVFPNFNCVKPNYG